MISESKRCVNNQFGGLFTVLTCVFRLNKLNAKIIFGAKNTFNFMMSHKLCVIYSGSYISLSHTMIKVYARIREY